MTDEEIVEMYWMRSEDAISQTRTRYGKVCRAVAYGILRDREDAEECENDTYLNAWNSMPPSRPARLLPFLSRITRNLALNRYDYRTAQKRGEMTLALEELGECVSGGGDMADGIFVTEVLNKFLRGLSEKNRDIFVNRYWFMCSVKEIAQKYQISESDVKVSLHRTRKMLKKILEKEGIL